MERLLSLPNYAGKMMTIFVATERLGSCGSVAMGKEAFDSLIRHLLSSHGKYNKGAEMVYNFGTLECRIEGFAMQAYRREPIAVETVQNFVVLVEDRIGISEFQFPTVAKYNDIKKRNTMTFCSGAIQIVLVRETHSRLDVVRYPYLSFRNDGSVSPQLIEGVMRDLHIFFFESCAPNEISPRESVD